MSAGGTTTLTMPSHYAGYLEAVSRTALAPYKAPEPSLERWTCAHCGTLKEWRSVDPGPKKCESCGAPRKAT